jgi:hypothetical protein
LAQSIRKRLSKNWKKMDISLSWYGPISDNGAEHKAAITDMILYRVCIKWTPLVKKEVHFL